MPDSYSQTHSLPAGSTDCHAHVFAPAVPPAASMGALMAAAADLSAYRRMQRRLGLERAVLVQPNAYRADNSCLLQALEPLGSQARGVAVVGPGVSDAELVRLHKGGVRAARIMQFPGGAVGMQELLAVNARIRALGWSCIVQFEGREMALWRRTLERVQGDYVIDHLGKFGQPLTPDCAAFRALLGLVDRGNCYVKIAACYETSLAGYPDYQDVAALARALIAHAPQRIIWGTNWPHLSRPRDEAPDDAELLDTVWRWMPDAQIRQQILVDNPARLYGF
ncbi:amidohydrolase family protein [Marinobacterium rhizophilum]|uniref:Amidohydrolase family protein n=1 Tax=Marinobacterium rhizophilum TaxID=420402 RepID=A0ABY5HFR3_9GAMM|nr:amidohydrolase family protein [Marinobacterium rhizophilum]UTW10428.1 amidohydrolase family protein [Marinobacterium rhizophilum]